jgi:serine/threonine-protein kinase
VSALAPGTELGRYRIETLLGRGGMGDVYRAEDTLLRRKVALKVLRPDTTPSSGVDENRRRLLREARAAAAFEHPNVVTIYDVGEVGGIAFIAMQLVEGVSLRTFVGRNDVAFEQRMAWLLGVARALAAAHRAGLVHRDVKPDNVMVCDGGIKVLDFGIAKMASSAQTGESIAYSTQPGGWVGTPRYMAPEQRMGQTDPRSDQYAWALCAYELLGGELPPMPDAPVRPLPETVNVPSQVWSVMQRALAEDPSRRFFAMDEIVAALGAFDVAAFGPTVAAPAVSLPHPPAPQATPLSAYSTVQSRAGSTPPSQGVGSLPAAPAAIASVPPPTGPNVRAAPRVHTMASPGGASKSRLGLALGLAGLGLLVLGGVGALAVFLVVNHQGGGPAASASTSASGTHATVTPTATATASPAATATANATTTAVVTATPTATTTATATATATSTATGRGATTIADAGSAIVDAGKSIEAGAPVVRRAFVTMNSPNYPMTDMMSRARTIQPGLDRCVRQLPETSTLTNVNASCFVQSWDGTVTRCTLNGNAQIPDGVSGCIDGILRSQTYPKPQGAGIVSVSISVR